MPRKKVAKTANIQNESMAKVTATRDYDDTMLGRRVSKGEQFEVSKDRLKVLDAAKVISIDKINAG